MSMDTISPLRQRMIEDMNARKLGAGTQHSGKLIAVANRDPKRHRNPPEVAPTRLPTNRLNFGVRAALLN